MGIVLLLSEADRTAQSGTEKAAKKIFEGIIKGVSRKSYPTMSAPLLSLETSFSLCFPINQSPHLSIISVFLIALYINLTFNDDCNARRFCKDKHKY